MNTRIVTVVTFLVAFLIPGVALAAAPAQQCGPHDALAHHWHAAGSSARAGEHALRAAEAAERELAFERVVDRLRDYVAWAEPKGVDLGRARIRIADALAQAGRSKEAQMALADAKRQYPPLNREYLTGFLGNWINEEFDAAGVQLD